jgi:hypothetical protein
MRPAAAGHAPAIDRVRLLLAGLMLVLVIAGVGAGPALIWHRNWHGPWHDDGVAIMAVVELVCAGLLAALWMARRRTPHPGNPAAKLRYALVRVIPLTMVALAVPLARYIPTSPPRPLPKPSPRQTPKARRPLITLRPQPGSGSALAGEVIKYLVLAVVAAALVTAFILLLRRLRASADEPDLAPEEDDGSMLRDAVEAGRLALGQLSEPRMAIIKCYLAMERSLGQAGAARVAAETPDELLARSLAAGLLHGDAAGQLTALFYEARFSSHPVPQSARDQALRALDVISAELRAADRIRQAPAGSAAGP